MAVRHKTALLTWAVVYLLITTLLALFEPLLQGLPLPVRTLILTAVMVPAMAYVALPLALRTAAPWLQATPSSTGNQQ